MGSRQKKKRDVGPCGVRTVVSMALATVGAAFLLPLLWLPAQPLYDGEGLPAPAEEPEAVLPIDRAIRTAARDKGRTVRLKLADGTVEELTMAICAAQRPVSLTAHSEEDEERQIDVATEPFDERVVELTALREAIGCLSSEDRRLILERYINSRTQTVTAGLMGMTQVQVSRRESRIIKELRRLMEG